MRRIAIIPARSGSKGLPDKNLKEVAGQSLLARAVHCAVQADLFARVYVSTDSAGYAEAAAAAGIETPFLRPPELAADDSLAADAIAFTLDAFEGRGERFDTLCLIEPTSPLRTPGTVREVVEAAEEEGWDAAFTVSPVPIHFHGLKQYAVGADGAARFRFPGARPNINRQTLAPTYVRNGLCYAVRTEAFRATHSVHGRRPKACIIEGPAISIDSAEDLDAVRRLIER